MDQLFDGRVSVKLKDDTTPRGQWALPADEPLSVGRLASSGLHIPFSWVPSRLCRFIPYERGWVVQLGRPRATVGSRYIGKHTFGSRAMVALQPGRSLIHFPELDDNLYLSVTIGAGVCDGLEKLADGARGERDEIRTRYAVDDVNISAEHRTVLAVTFHHLLAHEPKPANVALAAGQVLGKSEQAVKNVITTTRQKVNRERWLDLKDADHLGQYLCRLTRTITYADLPQHLK